MSEHKICRSSDWKETKCPVEGAIRDTKTGKWKIKIKSVQDLIDLSIQTDEEIIIDKDGSLEIYDDYREL